MEWTFSWNLVSIVTQAMPHSGVFVSDLSATKTRSQLLKLPSSVPLDLLILRIFLVVLCIFSVLLYAGLVRAPPASVGVFLRIVLPDFLGSSLSFQCRTLRFPKNRTRAFLLVVARCAASCLWKSMNEAFDVIGKRSVYGTLRYHGYLQCERLPIFACLTCKPIFLHVIHV